MAMSPEILSGLIQGGFQLAGSSIQGGLAYAAAKDANNLALQQTIFGQTVDLANANSAAINTIAQNNAGLNQAIANKYSGQRKSLLDNTNSTYLWMAGIAAGALLIAVLIFKR